HGQRVAGNVGGRAGLRQHGVVRVPDGPNPRQWSRPLGLNLLRGSQVDDCCHAYVVDQQLDVGRRETLQIVPAKQPARQGGPAVVGVQPAEVTDVDGAIEFDPSHAFILAARDSASERGSMLFGIYPPSGGAAFTTSPARGCQNAPVPSGVPMPVGASYPFLATQR